MCVSLEEKFGAWELFEELWEKFVKVKDKSDDAAFNDEMEKMLQESGYHEKLKLSSDVKDNDKAAFARALGNDFFHPKAKRYIESVKQYNESILFSEKGSEARALAYANRSAVCFELCRYQDCLENIRLARESNYPARLASKLNKREKEATEALKKDVNNNKLANKIQTTKSGQESSHVTLSYDASESLPQVVNCLELRQNKQFGRFVATTRNLKAGDVVIIEKPFCTLLLDVYRYMRCDFCYSERLFTLIPCESCTVAMYCSNECMKLAHQRYHRYECPIIRDMWRIFTKIPIMALRTVINAIASFDHDLNSMKKHIQEMDKSKVNAFAMDWKKATPRDIYDTVHVLVTNQHNRDKKDIMLRIFFSSIIRDLLLERTELGAICKDNTELPCLLMELLLRHVQTTPANMHSMYYMDYQPNEKVFEPTNYASACFPLLSMLNHSCAPNLTRVALRDGRCAAVILRPIPKHGQLYDNYGQHHCLMQLGQRRVELLSQYKFLCKCEACENDYPLFNNLPHINVSQYGLIDTSDIHARLVLHQPNIADELMPKLCQYLNDIGYQYPRYEVSSCQELFLRCFQILHMHASDISQYWKYCNP